MAFIFSSTFINNTENLYFWDRSCHILNSVEAQANCIFSHIITNLQDNPPAHEVFLFLHKSSLIPQTNNYL